jgi:tetratricopeptide (TPR) repeat protein
MFLRKLFRLVPGSALRHALVHFDAGEFEAAATELDALLAATSAPGENLVRYAAEAHVEAGRRQAASGNAPAALVHFERAVELRPRYADLHTQLARLYESTDRTEMARAAYERALSIHPAYLEARLGLARLLVHLGEGGAAMRQLQEAVRSAPESAAGALQEIASSLASDLPLPAAGARLDALLGALAPAPALRDRIAAAQQALRAGDAARAITVLKELLQQHPDYPDLHHLLGVAYDAEEMTDDAIEEFERALGLNPVYAEARLNLGLALFRRGRDAEAERHLRRVTKQDPAHDLARSLLERIAARSDVH